jgi:hypothetical protein
MNWNDAVHHTLPLVLPRTERENNVEPEARVESDSPIGARRHLATVLKNRVKEIVDVTALSARSTPGRPAM